MTNMKQMNNNLSVYVNKELQKYLENISEVNSDTELKDKTYYFLNSIKKATNSSETRDSINLFLRNLDSLSRDYKIELRRNFGKPYSEASNKARIGFFIALPQKSIDVKYRWFFIATLYCFYDCKESKLTLVEALKKIEKGSIEKTFINLLDERLEEDSLMLYKTARLIKILKGKDLKVNAGELLKDLIYWNTDNETVQNSWIEQYYR